jgi:hypothetical protein
VISGTITFRRSGNMAEPENPAEKSRGFFGGLRILIACASIRSRFSFPEYFPGPAL